MSIKVDSSLPADLATGALNQAGSAPSDPVQGAQAEPLDPMDRIAGLAATGQIGQSQAVNQILDCVRSMPILRSAPPEIRSEIIEALGMLLESDPHLRSLAAAISSQRR